jgi:hypothetical protein
LVRGCLSAPAAVTKTWLKPKIPAFGQIQKQSYWKEFGTYPSGVCIEVTFLSYCGRKRDGLCEQKLLGYSGIVQSMLFVTPRDR